MLALSGASILIYLSGTHISCPDFKCIQVPFLEVGIHKKPEIFLCTNCKLWVGFHLAFELTIHIIDDNPGFNLVIGSRAACSHFVDSYVGLLWVSALLLENIFLFTLFASSTCFGKAGLEVLRLLPYFPAPRQGA